MNTFTKTRTTLQQAWNEGWTAAQAAYSSGVVARPSCPYGRNPTLSRAWQKAWNAFWEDMKR